ncbi:MAG TPA: CotH kinase family protein [Vicinamibacteria bacterium]|nr:CotH kinase family protein [Vicinamibacteria bacterium]
MYVKEPDDRSVWRRTARPFGYLRRHRLLAKLLAVLLGIGSLAAVALSCVYYGATLHRDHRIQGWEQIVHYVIDSGLAMPVNYVKGFAAPVESMTIDISLDNLQQLAYVREIAFINDEIPDASYVGATLTVNGKVHDVKVKLHGTLVDHVNSDKWSLRVKTKGEDTVFGMKKFNLMHPKTRYGIYEWVCHKLHVREDLIALRTDFVDVTLNGAHKGIYFLEEAFDKRMIEHNRHREGLLFKPTRSIPVFDKDKALVDPNMERQMALLQETYDAFLDGEIPPARVFDLEKMAKFYAIVDLVGGFHQLLPANMHFYLNPVSGRFDPVGREWDVHFYRPIRGIWGESRDTSGLGLSYRDVELHRRLFDDPDFYRLYVRELERISSPEYLDGFFAEIDGELDAKLAILHKQYSYYSFSKDYFFQNAETIRRTLAPSRPLKAYRHAGDGDRVVLSIQNLVSVPMEILSLSRGGVVLEPVSPAVLPPASKEAYGRFERVSFPALGESPEVAPGLVVPWVLSASVLGSTTRLPIDVLPWPYEGGPVRRDLVRQEPNHREFEFVEVDESSGTLFLKPGEWQLPRNLVIPPGLRVVSHGGFHLDLRSSAAVLSYSPLYLLGSEEEPIVIESSDRTGQGLVVLSAGEVSKLNHVTFRNLSNPNQLGWTLTGAITFYESPVEFTDCRFVENGSEDGLNIIRSEFLIRNSLFDRPRADALDADFSRGSIENTMLRGCGNDGIDVSGSQIELRQVVIDGAEDKALSVGEHSVMRAWDVEIRNAELAVASKDSSEMILENITLSRSTIGFTAYVKKAEFGPASINARGVRMEAVEIPFLVEESSSVIVDGVEAVSSRKNVKDILYGVEFGKASVR